MITPISQRMMRRAFEKVRYRYTEIPPPPSAGNFGIYVHVPFCRTKCSFCPFYKELFSKQLKREYLEAINEEIKRVDFQGKTRWIYFGGGTPNTLTVDEINGIVTALRQKVSADSIGIELLPAGLTREYLEKLKDIGVTKISLGVESFSEDVLGQTGRKTAPYEEIKAMVEAAQSMDLWVNTDLMVGLKGQTPSVFLDDIQKIAVLHPHQVTTYPLMVMRGQKYKSCIPPQKQFELIEKAGGILADHGYGRNSVWIFSLGSDVYDTSGDELVEDYLGFGPGAFSTYGDWKVVNPPLDIYVDNIKNGSQMGFIAPKSKPANIMRRFAKMIYDLRCSDMADFPLPVKIYVKILKFAGYSQNGFLTPKGTIFAHAITKTVVEALPMPIQNPSCVENWDDIPTSGKK